MDRNHFHLSVWTVSSLGLLAPGVWWVDVWLRAVREPSATGDRNGGGQRVRSSGDPKAVEAGKKRWLPAGPYGPQFGCCKKLGSGRSRCAGRPETAQPRRGRDDGRGRHPFPRHGQCWRPAGRAGVCEGRPPDGSSRPAGARPGSCSDTGSVRGGASLPHPPRGPWRPGKRLSQIIIIKG